MSKAKFEYDENGATFSYFLLSFLVIVLVPTTYHLWPYKTTDLSLGCRCSGCQSKRQYQKDSSKRVRYRKSFVRLLIVIGWILVAFTAYCCSSMPEKVPEWNPFQVLGIDENSDEMTIKKAYRKLSLQFHPDKGSTDPTRFVEISKAYATLTDEETRKNWENYGNPDGPRFATYGIALPSWIVEKENSFFVLGIYALLFMIALPVSVGAWWYNTLKFGNDKVLLVTTEFYFHFIHQTPNMAMKRAIAIVAASLEFSKFYNKEIVERESDNQEVPKLIREIPLLGVESTKEKPLYFSYSVKARAIIHAHLGRIKLPHSTLESDRIYIIKKCPCLIREFVQCTSQLITLAMAGRTTNKPTLFTLENAMKLGTLITQALWEYESPLLQLPHFTKETMKYLAKRKDKIETIEQLARMKDSDRRAALKNFDDLQYADIKLVLASMPSIRIDCKFEVLDDVDQSTITAHSIVTARVNLKRVPLCNLVEKDGTNGDSSSIGEKHEQLSPDTNQQDSMHSGLKKKKTYESNSKLTHTVHCPYFPEDKQEYWWLYIIERKRSALITAPILVTNLKTNQELELKFTAPKVGSYCYTVVVRSDSYIECTAMRHVQFDVSPATIEIVSEDESNEEIDDDRSSFGDSDLMTDED